MDGWASRWVKNWLNFGAEEEKRIVVCVPPELLPLGCAERALA